MRHASSALRRGDIEFVAAVDPAEFVAFRRFDNKETLLVGLNRGDDAYRWKIPLEQGQGVVQIFTASGDVGQFAIETTGNEAVVTVPPIDGVVLRVTTKE